MKKLITILTLSMFGLFSCSSCKTPNIPDSGITYDASIADTSTDTLVEDDGMQVKTDDFELYFDSNKDWEVVELNDLPAKVVFSNKKLETAVIFTIDSFTGTTQDLSLFVLRGMKESDHLFLESDFVKINDKEFINLILSKQNYNVFIWTFSNKKNSFVLSCAGKQIRKNQKEICYNIAKTLIIK